MLFGNGPGVDLISVAAAVKMAHSFTYCPHYCAFFVLGKRLVAVTKYWRAIKVLEVCETICAGGKLSTTPRQPANCLLYYIHTMRQHSVGMHLASTIEFLGGGGCFDQTALWESNHSFCRVFCGVAYGGLLMCCVFYVPVVTPYCQWIAKYQSSDTAYAEYGDSS